MRKKICRDIPLRFTSGVEQLMRFVIPLNVFRTVRIIIIAEGRF